MPVKMGFEPDDEYGIPSDAHETTAERPRLHGNAKKHSALSRMYEDEAQEKAELSPVRAAFVAYDIDVDARDKIADGLHLLRNYDLNTYMHSIRTGLLAARIGESCGYEDPGALLVAGLLHDVGKTIVDPDAYIINKRQFTHQDFLVIQGHVRASYGWMMDHHFKWSAGIAKWHHTDHLTGLGYPNPLPTGPFGPEDEETFRYLGGLLLRLADCFDAATTRRIPDPTLRGQFYARHKYSAGLIRDLEIKGIFAFPAASN